MLMKIEHSNLYEADELIDVYRDYKKLINNLVYIKSECKLYMVLPKIKGHGTIVRIHAHSLKILKDRVVR
ncbi:unnamed protein product [marine sediment metagenome]|uniref:Uncharacterized protein n=1 Tax=marine sediment metagenome TaxID=412755 RepID=X0W589_9ZZZZ